MRYESRHKIKSYFITVQCLLPLNNCKISFIIFSMPSTLPVNQCRLVILAKRLIGDRQERAEALSKKGSRGTPTTRNKVNEGSDSGGSSGAAAAKEDLATKLSAEQQARHLLMVPHVRRTIMGTHSNQDPKSCKPISILRRPPSVLFGYIKTSPYHGLLHTVSAST